ncbi:15064_t:CDS:2, partial [Acaulospora colombiana]
MENTPDQPVGTSRRAQHFRSALNLVHKKSATAWTLEQFLACVGTWGEENPDKAAAMREKADEILAKYKAYEGIDCLAEAVAEARTATVVDQPQSNGRRRSSVSAKQQKKKKDTWRAELAPRSAVHAVTVPLLEAEKERLERDLAEVERLCEDALNRFRDHRDKAIEAKIQVSRLLDGVDRAKDAYDTLNVEEMSEWTMRQLTHGHASLRDYTLLPTTFEDQAAQGYSTSAFDLEANLQGDARVGLDD